jgi:crotonobetainyl-CoA:carnitine CoA-transferase CaiB-like acyl-CoA transferase
MSTPLPLEGLRVVDTTSECGALCARMLADFGADVVLVEPPGGSSARTLPPYLDDGTSTWFLFRNANKRGVVLDASTAGDRDLFAALLASADVLVDGDGPASAAAFGFDTDALQRRFPRLVTCSITNFGRTGPYSGHAATDDVVFAVSGWLQTSGIPSKPPLLMPGSLPSDAAGVMGVFATLAALVQRRTNGSGQYLDVSALETTIQLNTWGIPNTSATLAAGQQPNLLRNGTGPMYPLIRTADGFVRLVILSPRQWNAMFEWLGSPEAFADPMWATTFARLTNADVLNPLFEEHFSTMSMEECAAEAQRRGIVATPMLRPDQVLRNEHFVSRHTFVDAEVAPGVTAQVAAGFIEGGGDRWGFRFRAPQLGEHNDDVLGRLAPAPADEGGARPAPAPPLAGVKVLDFGHGGVGVEGGRMLVEYGADVIKVETRSYPDFMRLIMGTEMTPSFASSSRSKRSFGVNLKTPEGLALVHRLAAQADIVIENNSTGTMTDMGVGYEVLAALNPSITMASSQLVGSHGAYASWIGYGPTTQPFGGMNYLWNFADGDAPPGSPAIHPDHFAGRLCAIVGLLGVWVRERSGHGFHGEIAQVEAVVNTIGDLLLKESVQPGTVQPEGNDDERGAPWGVFRCAGDDQWCVVTVRDDADWLALRAAMGDPEAARDERFATAAGRKAARAEVNAIVGIWTSGLAPREAMTKGQQHGVPVGAMLSSLDHLTDPHLEARGFLVPVKQQDSSELVFEGPAFSGTAMAPPRITQAPRLGEHTREICRELGLDDEEIDTLVAVGALEVPREA